MSDSYMTISGLGNLVDNAFTNDESVSESLYSLYKGSYKLSLSNYFRGDTADKVKEYIAAGPINCINGLMNVSSEFVTIIQLITAAFNSYEASKNGVISEPVLDYIEDELRKKKSKVESTRAELSSVISKASAYITTTPLQIDDLVGRFDAASDKSRKIAETISEIDAEGLKYATELFNRCTALKAMIVGTRKLCYTGEQLSLDKTGSLGTQDWYSKEGNVALQIKMAEDPFEYHADEVTVSEDQWAAGLCKDVYAYCGYSFLHGEYEAGVENGKYFAAAAGSVLAANAYLQVTDYVKAKGEVQAVYGEGKANAGWSDSYKGVRLEGEVGLFKADGSVTIGSDDFNGYIKGEVKVLTADGKAAFEFKEDGEFAIGFDASATGASASGRVGFSFFSVDYKENPSDKSTKIGLLSASVEPEVGGTAGAALWAESKKAIETPIGNINATTIKVKGVLGIGGKVSITVPTIHPKWPWDW